MTDRAHDMRAASLRAGLQGSVLLCTAVGGWALASPDRPHRPLVLAVVGVFALIAAVLACLPADRIVRHPRADHLYAAWSVLAIAGISAIVALDGGDGLSPLTLTYATPLVYAALAYPMRMVVGVSLVDAAACAATLALTTELGTPDVAYVTALLLIVAFLCAQHGRAHARHAAQAEQLSRTDVLTGCLNRRGFDEELARRVARRQRYGSAFGLVLFDLDDFKDVNDRYGHAAGDELLRRVAATAAGTVRTGDAVCRIGGDEFAVLLDDATTACAEHAAGRLRTALAEHAEVSVGWASCPHDATDGDALYRSADALLYRHKAGPGALSQPAAA